MMTSLNDDIT